METKLDTNKILFVLEKLKDEYKYVPKNQIGTLSVRHAGAGIGGRSSESGQQYPLQVVEGKTITEMTLHFWYEKSGLDQNGLAKILDLFEREGLITDYTFTYELLIYFPENFKQLYHKFKEQISGKKIEITKEDNMKNTDQEKLDTLPDHQKGEALYFIEIDDNTREIILNREYIMVRPQLGKENGYFLEYMIGHPNQLVKKEDIENKFGIKITKTFYHILSDLKFSPELRRIFFPEMAEKFAKFRNNVTEKELEILGINRKKLDAYIKTLKKIKRKRQKK